jgi:hypothetical protein
LLTIFNPNLIISIILNLINIFAQSELLGSNKAEYFTNANVQTNTFINTFSLTFLMQIGIGILCIAKLRKDLSLDVNQHKYLTSLRFFGISQILIIMITLPVSILPLRLGLFYFLYFPLWLLNIPFLSISKKINNYRKYLILFAILFVLNFTLNTIPKIQARDYSDSKTNADIVVLEGKPLDYNLIQLIEYFL